VFALKSWLFVTLCLPPAVAYHLPSLPWSDYSSALPAALSNRQPQAQQPQWRFPLLMRRKTTASSAFFLIHACRSNVPKRNTSAF
jgi:hypothetical protein